MLNGIQMHPSLRLHILDDHEHLFSPCVRIVIHHQQNTHPQQRPELSRGDSDWGTDNVMSQMEQKGYDYLFKVKKSKYVKQLIFN